MVGEIYESPAKWDPSEVNVMAVYCSDGRWAEAFRDFCLSIGMDRYDRFAVPGGPVWMTLREVRMAEEFEAAREQLQFLARAHNCVRIAIITHYGCGFYQDALGLDAAGCLPAQVEDLHAAARTLREWFENIQVDAFVAMYREGTDQIYFESVPV